MLTMCEAGWRVQAFTTSLREGLHPHWKITGNKITLLPTPISPVDGWREKKTISGRDAFPALRLPPLEVVPRGPSTCWCVCVGGVAFPFRDAALLGAEQRSKPTHWPCVFNFTWILWSSKWVSGVSFQPAFLEVWQGSGSRAEASSGNGH